MITKVYEKGKKLLKENYKFLIGIVLYLFLVFYKLPYVVYRPGDIVDLETRVKVEDAYEQKGTLALSYVSAMNGNIPFVLLSFLLPNWDLIKTDSITLDDESLDESLYRDRLYLEEGLDNATLSAFRLANKEIHIENIYHTVIYIDKQANTDLEMGDVILSMDNQEFRDLDDLKTYVNSLKVGDTVHFKVKRGEEERKCYATIYELEDSLKVGIAMVNKFEYETNPKVSIETKESESGSSGGLMTSLAIYNAITKEDITKGKLIVGTGTIDEYGTVGEIGGIKYKLLGAEKNKADVFLCPEENYEEAMEIKEKKHLNLEIIAVSTLQDAVNALENLN